MDEPSTTRVRSVQWAAVTGAGGAHDPVVDLDAEAVPRERTRAAAPLLALFALVVLAALVGLVTSPGSLPAAAPPSSGPPGSAPRGTTPWKPYVPPPPVTPAEPPAFAATPTDRRCQVSRQLANQPVDGQTESPREIFQDLTTISPDANAAPVPGAAAVFDQFSSNHASASTDDLGADDLVVSSRGYASQAGAFGGAFVSRYDPVRHAVTPILQVCIDDASVELAKELDGSTRLYGLTGGDGLVVVDVAAAAIVTSSDCANCNRAIAPADRSNRHAVLLDGGDAIIAVRQWGTKLAATSFDAADGHVRSSVVLDTDGRVVRVPGQLWTISATQGLIRWDPATGARLAQLPAPYSSDGEQNSLVADGLSFAGGSFWTADPGAGVVEQHDPTTFAVHGRLAVPGLATMTTGGDHLWLAARTNASTVVLEQLDTGSAQVSTRLELASFAATDVVDGQKTSRTYVPDLQVDDRGFWVTMPNGDAGDPASSTAPVDVGELMFWGDWTAYRWEPPTR
jgi:hypothetical protein